MIAPIALPDPVELGFAAKFRQWNPDQITAIDKVVNNEKRFTALALPTGAGKTLTGVASALLHPKVKRALYLTSSKGLQDQASDDFASVGLFDIRGQRNYPCLAIQPGGELQEFRRGKWDTGCDAGPCHSGVRCTMAPVRGEHMRPLCKYYAAIYDARKREVVSTNYAMWLAAQHYSEGLGEFDLLILDEAHDADKELESFLTLEVTTDDCHYLNTKFPKSTELSVWRDWAVYHRGPLTSRIELRELHPPSDAEGAKDLRAMKAVLGKVERLSKIDPLSWVIDADQMRVKFAPVRVHQYAEEYLFRKTPRVVLMSATMTRKTTQLLGIDPQQLVFWEAPSRFPLAHRPVISVNTTPGVRVTAKMNDDDKYMWLRRIDRIIEPRRALGYKGIIHTVSYQRMKELLANSEHRDLMLAHDTGGTRDTVAKFKASTGPAILVSPSIVTGYDFPGDQARYQIIAKVPIPDMRGPIMSMRNELDPDYAGYLAMVKLVQACGRIVRGPQDWGETVLVDDTFADWFFNKYRRHAPRWFIDAVQYVDTFPEPLHIAL